MRICAWCNGSLEDKPKNREFCDNDCYRQFIRNGPKKMRELRHDLEHYKEHSKSMNYKVLEQNSKWWAFKKLFGLI